MDPGSRATVEQSILSLFRAIDDDDADGVAAMFIPDGVWRRRDGDRIGRDAIADEMRRRPRGRRIVHLVSNLIVTFDGAARCDMTFRTLAFADDAPMVDRPSPLSVPIALDGYRATLVTRDRVWLTASLASERLFARI